MRGVSKSIEMDNEGSTQLEVGASRVGVIETTCSSLEHYLGDMLQCPFDISSPLKW